MSVEYGDGQRDGFIEVPAHIQDRMILGNGDAVAVIFEGVAEACLNGILGIDGLSHRLEATVTRNLNGSNGVNVKLETGGLLFHPKRGRKLSVLDVLLIKVAEE